MPGSKGQRLFELVRANYRAPVGEARGVFVTEAALKRLQPAAERDEASLLRAFDALQRIGNDAAFSMS
jgi:hypothetical protein